MVDDIKIKKSIEKFVNALLNLNLDLKIPVALSNHHVHLREEDFDMLFGFEEVLHEYRILSQPGQFACQETVDLIGPKRTITKVRVLAPFRSETQVEISLSDGFFLGLHPPIRQSGKLENTPGIKIRGPKCTLLLQEGVICAARHIHMTPEDAKRFDVKDKQLVSAYFISRRSGILDDVRIRVNPQYSLEMHVDNDEGNAFGLKNGDVGFILPDIDNRIYSPE